VSTQLVTSSKFGQAISKALSVTATELMTRHDHKERRVCKPRSLKENRTPPWQVKYPVLNTQEPVRWSSPPSRGLIQLPNQEVDCTLQSHQ